MLKFDRRILLAAAIGASLTLGACSKGAGVAASAEDMSMGKPDAPIKMVEYASASCSHCADFNNDVFPAFKAKYIDTGKVHYTLKEMLTPPEPMAAAGFLIARCAGKDRYFEVLDAVFRSQRDIYATGDMRGGLLRVAQSAGMTEEQFSTCVSDEKAAQALSERTAKNAKEAPEGTPTFYVNGKKLKVGPATLEELETAIAAAGK